MSQHLKVITYAGVYGLSKIDFFSIYINRKEHEHQPVYSPSEGLIAFLMLLLWLLANAGQINDHRFAEVWLHDDNACLFKRFYIIRVVTPWHIYVWYICTSHCMCSYSTEDWRSVTGTTGQASTCLWSMICPHVYIFIHISGKKAT